MSQFCGHATATVSPRPSVSFDTLTHLHLATDTVTWKRWVRQEETQGVTGRVVASTHPQAWTSTQKVASDANSDCLLGIHPWWANQVDPSTRNQHYEWLKTQTLLSGIGEIGLDYVRAKTTQQRSVQKAVLEEQLALAHSLSLPVLLHCVRAHSDLLHILKGFSQTPIHGVFHGWTGGPQYIDTALNLGFSVSFGPSLLQPQRQKIHESAKRVPMDRLCIETDWPDGVRAWEPAPGQGALKTVAAHLARLRDAPIESVWAACGANAANIWGRSIS